MQKKTFFVDDIAVTSDIEGFDLESAEHCVNTIRESETFPFTELHVTKTASGAWAVEYEAIPPKFERIRRITGYLVGTMDRWNNAKRSEESERVKHV